ncbi:hypothetical protein B6A27_05640 [Anoxybacillus sp. UARK-01]|uniref:hypothetical protein n=1 Tax=Anoxybacillus sp. UARK-01 TaxID=1895648 RepID=UPI0009BB8074|nr:hypothetical protein [Anoxybacillus sp. UARK-01]OQM46640.1 hypothetical protein B6A27_05640 [Anoxybacillus sp. UARK-01]
MGQNPPNHQIQLQQKIIHYRSEIAKYETQLKALETELQKEKLRNEYLLDKLHLTETTHIEPYEKKIAQLEQQMLSYEVALEEAERQIQHLKQLKYTEQEEKTVPAVTKAQAFFAYSLLLPETSEEEIIVIGDFVIQNIGNEPLSNLIVCIRSSPKRAGELSGKIATKPLPADSHASDAANETMLEWTFAYEDWKEKIKEGEYWLKPTHMKKLMPNEELRFSHFEMRINQIEDIRSVVVNGFVYCNEIPRGLASLNHIIINL